MGSANITDYLQGPPGTLPQAGQSGVGAVSSNPGQDMHANAVSAGYAPAMSAAAGQMGYYSGLAGQQQSIAAPTIQNRTAQQAQGLISGNVAGMGALGNQLGATAANGQNSAAYQQYSNSIQQGEQAQTAVANSAGGGSLGLAGARRAASEQNGMTSAGAVAGGQQVAASAQAQAQGQLGTLLGQQGSLQNQNYAATQQAALAQAQLQQQQQQTNNAGQLGYTSLAANEGGQYLNTVEGASNQLLADQGLGQQQQAVNNAQFNTYLGAAASGGGAGLAAVGKSASNDPSPSQPTPTPYDPSDPGF